MTLEKITQIIREKEPKIPIPPEISNLEAIAGQNEINTLLNRDDVVSNALPSHENEPLVVLVHGYSASKWLWLDPYFGTHGWLTDYRNDPKPRSYGWHPTSTPGYMYIPFAVSSSPLVFPEGIFNFLMRKGFELLTYSQVDAFGDIDNSAKELDILLKAIHKIYGNRRLILVGHSRGGICIRRYLDLMNNSQIEKVITLATPHKGTSFSNAPIIKQPAIKILNETALRNIWDITGKRKIKDLTLQQMGVNSDYLQNLADYDKYPEIEYVAAAGTNSTFTNIYAWSARRAKQRLANLASKLFNKTNQIKRKENKKTKIVIVIGERRKYYHWIAYPRKIFSIFEKTILPEMICGDGFVCTKSALFEEADRQYQIDANHEEMAVCKEVKELVLQELKLSQKKK